MTRVPFRPDPSAADRMGGDPGIRIIKKATPEERAAAHAVFAAQRLKDALWLKSPFAPPAEAG